MFETTEWFLVKFLESRVFRKDREPGSNHSGKPLRLYKHRSDAIRREALSAPRSQWPRLMSNA